MFRVLALLCAAYSLDIDPLQGSTPSPGRVHALLLCRVSAASILGVPVGSPQPPVTNAHGDIVDARNSMAKRIDDTVSKAFVELPSEYTTLCVFAETDEQRAAFAAEVARKNAPTAIASKYARKAAVEPVVAPPPPEPITKTGGRSFDCLCKHAMTELAMLVA
jgi:hypothetical protein